VTETTASTVEEYVSLAVRLGKDVHAREEISRKIALNKRKVYRDRNCIVALEDFLEKAAGS
jgi:protein O-GlcNAc transferase